MVEKKILKHIINPILLHITVYIGIRQSVLVPRRSTNNKLAKIINGNRRTGYNIGLWNCRRGLIEDEKKPSSKMAEVKHFLQNKKLHILCLVEADLHGITSRYKRLNPLTTKDIDDNLGISGYKIFLPKSWQVHGQARIMVIAKEELQVKIRDFGRQNSDLPSLTCEIGLAREKKTVVNFFYREFTGGVSGLKDNQSQLDRLSRQVRHWRTLCSGSKMSSAWVMQICVHLSGTKITFNRRTLQTKSRTFSWRPQVHR